jgi:hypothetical protein
MRELPNDGVQSVTFDFAMHGPAAPLEMKVDVVILSAGGPVFGPESKDLRVELA